MLLPEVKPLFSDGVGLATRIDAPTHAIELENKGTGIHVAMAYSSAATFRSQIIIAVANEKDQAIILENVLKFNTADYYYFC